MRTAFLLPNLAGGGAERVLLTVADFLSGEGHRVDLVLMAVRGEYLKDVPGSVNIVNLGCPRLWTSLPAFAGYLRRNRPDSVLSAMPLANGIAAWARVVSRVDTRLILSERNIRSLTFGDGATPKRYAALQYPIRWSYHWADDVIAVSGGVAERVRKLPRMRPERVHVVHNPVDGRKIENRASESANHPWFEDRSVPVVLGVGRLVAQKDFGTLIRAFRLVRKRREAKLIILGEGKERDALERLTTEFGLRDSVDLPGFVANPWAYMARSKVFVLSSIHEGFGNVLVEAMACGTPVVSTDCPFGPADILDHGAYGPLIPVSDASALAIGIVRMLDEPTPSELLKSRAKEFGVEKACRRYLDLLDPLRSKPDAQAS